MPESKQAVVIGGGICGLACAYRLKQLGARVQLLEAAEHCGGMIRSLRKDGFLLDCGPQTFLNSGPLRELIRELGIESDLVQANRHAARYALARGRLQKIPLGLIALLASDLIGPRAKIRVLAEPLRRWKAATREESVADFVRRKFGGEILDYLVSPFVSGVYAGDPERLSFTAAFPAAADWERRYASVLRGAIKAMWAQKPQRPQLCSFRSGMEELTKKIAESLGGAIRANHKVEAIGRSGPGGRTGHGYELSCSPPDCRVIFVAEGRAGDSPPSPHEEAGVHTKVHADAVVLATPAYVSARLLRAISPQVGEKLEQVTYAPVAVVAEAYDRKQVGNPLHGFGVLFPRKEGLRTLGTVWNTSLFPMRAPAEKVLFTSFAGGTTDWQLLELAPEEIAAIVHGEIASVLKITGPPVATEVWRYPRGLPQYNLGHAELLRGIREALRETPGVFLAGNYLEGPSIASCVEQAFRTAEAVHGEIWGFSD